MDSDRKYVVQTLATMLMSYISDPSLKHCGVVAKALTSKFDFLKDGEGDGEVGYLHVCTDVLCTLILAHMSHNQSLQHSWKWFIYYRCKNVNKVPKGHSQEGCSPKKRPKIIDRAVHCNPPANADDEVSYERNLEQLKTEQLKTRARVDVLKDLMKRTFANRFGVLLEGGHPLTATDYLKEFPLLKKATYVSACKLVANVDHVIIHLCRQLRNSAVLLIMRACVMTMKNDF